MAIGDLNQFIRDVPDFPKPGIVFKDISPLLKSPAGLAMAVEQMANPYRGMGVELVCGAESRGFIFGPAIAQQLNIGFVPVRKPGKLPAATYQVSYDLEYGSDTLEVHQDAFTPGMKAVIVDDLIATGGTAAATAELVEQAGATVVGFSFLIELVDLKGRSLLPEVPVETLISY